jgi:hypothetical protein
MATCAVSTVKNEPRIVLKINKNAMPAKISSTTVVGSMFTLLISFPIPAVRRRILRRLIWQIGN